MSDLDAAFEKAQEDAKALPAKPSNNDMLDLYSLYKQASSGDVSGKRPGMFDPVGQAKYDAWEEKKGMSADDAKQGYIDKVTELGS